MSLDRRTLLAGAAAAVAGSTINASPAAGASAKATTATAFSNAAAPVAGAGFPVKKSLKIDMIKGARDLTEAFEWARDAGFDGVELNSPNEHSLADVLIARKATGLEIPGVVLSTHWQKPFSSHVDSVRAEAVANLVTAIEDCASYGGDTVLVVPGIVDKKTSYADAYERSQAELKTVVPYAEEKGIRLAFENVWNHFLLSPLEAARYVDEFESASVGWYLDVGNLVNFGWPEHWIEVLDERIMRIDCKSFSRHRRDTEGLWAGFKAPLGEGDCNWQAVVKALRDVGYEGWASAEVSGGDIERLKEIMERMKRIFNF